MMSGELEGTLPLGALRASIAAVDLTGCRDAGAPRGYGHARVTVQPEGRISKIVIDGPRAMPKAAISCVGDALAVAQVPAYTGRAVTVGTTWFVP